MTASTFMRASTRDLESGTTLPFDMGLMFMETEDSDRIFAPSDRLRSKDQLDRATCDRRYCVLHARTRKVSTTCCHNGAIDFDCRD